MKTTARIAALPATTRENVRAYCDKAAAILKRHDEVLLRARVIEVTRIPADAASIAVMLAVRDANRDLHRANVAADEILTMVPEAAALLSRLSYAERDLAGDLPVLEDLWQASAAAQDARLRAMIALGRVAREAQEAQAAR